MTQFLLFIAYSSNASVPFNADSLAELLAVSRRNNERAGVTGMLLYRGGNFLQALEGPTSAVRTTFERIAQDSRHRTVAILFEEMMDEKAQGLLKDYIFLVFGGDESCWGHFPA